MRVGFAGGGPDAAARVGESGLGRLRGHGRDVPGELDSMMAGWGGTPDETAAEAEALITIVPGNRELHDVMLIPRSARGPASPA